MTSENDQIKSASGLPSDAREHMQAFVNHALDTNDTTFFTTTNVKNIVTHYIRNVALKDDGSVNVDRWMSLYTHIVNLYPERRNVQQFAEHLDKGLAKVAVPERPTLTNLLLQDPNNRPDAEIMWRRLMSDPAAISEDLRAEIIASAWTSFGEAVENFITSLIAEGSREQASTRLDTERVQALLNLALVYAGSPEELSCAFLKNDDFRVATECAMKEELSAEEHAIASTFLSKPSNFSEVINTITDNVEKKTKLADHMISDNELRQVLERRLSNFIQTEAQRSVRIAPPRDSVVSSAINFICSLKPHLLADDFDALLEAASQRSYELAYRQNGIKQIVSQVFNSEDVRIFGRSFAFVNINDFITLAREVLIADEYRLRSMPQARRIVDLGASNGFFACVAAQLCPNAHVTSVEAAPYNIPLLRRNAGQFPSDRIDIIPAAVHWESKDVDLYVPQDLEKWGGLGASMRWRSRFEGRDVTKVQVQTVRLADIISSETDLLKIDIEGAEFELLENSAEVLKHVRRIAIEVHPDISGSMDGVRRIQDVLNANGFFQVTDGASSPQAAHGRPLKSFLVYGFRE